MEITLCWDYMVVPISMHMCTVRSSTVSVCSWDTLIFLAFTEAIRPLACFGLAGPVSTNSDVHGTLDNVAL